MLMTHVQFVMERKLSYHVATSHGLVWSCNDHAYATLTNRHPALRHACQKKRHCHAVSHGYGLTTLVIHSHCWC